VLEPTGNRRASHMTCYESFATGLYKPHFGLYKQRFVHTLDNFIKHFNTF
jgi:hypothetical protein